MNKTALRFTATVIIISALMGAVFAETVTAKLSNQPIIVDRTLVQMTAYNISGSNFVRLRDIGKAVNFGVSYDAATQTVYLDSKQSYAGDSTEQSINAPNEAAAALSAMPIYVDGARVQMTAYNIGGSNYVKMRDIGRALDFGVTYDEAQNTVNIDTSSPYAEDAPVTVPELPSIEKATGSGRFSSTPIKERWLDQGDVAKKDYSQYANPAIFDDVYTRGMYNAIRQTILDKDLIIPGNNEKGFNVYYDYAQIVVGKNMREANGVLGRITGYYTYETCGDPAAKEVYKYPNYSLVKVYFSYMHDEEVKLTEDIITKANALPTDRERVTLLNDYLCEIVEYSITEYSKGSVFAASKDAPYKGACADYARYFAFLCDRVDIICISVRGSNHVWNAVYVDGKWLYIDVSSNDLSGWNAILLAESYDLKSEDDPREAKLAMELLVPGSTIAK